MDNALSFLLGIASGLAGSALLAVLALSWRRLTVSAPARSFWSVDSQDEVCFALSLPVPDPAEHTVYVPTGDALAYGEIVALLRRLYPKVRVVFHRDSTRPITEWNRDIILIGGGKSNLTSRCLLAACDPPLYGRDHEHPQHYDNKGLILREDMRTHLQPTLVGESLSTDYAYLIRTPNPFYKDKWVFMVVGAHAHGTYGAALWATQPSNLRWLWRQRAVRAFAERFGLRPRTDSIEVVFSVPAVGQLSRGEIADVGQVAVWHHDGGEKAYPFSKPEGYPDLYNRMVREHGGSSFP